MRELDKMKTFVVSIILIFAGLYFIPINITITHKLDERRDPHIHLTVAGEYSGSPIYIK